MTVRDTVARRSDFEESKDFIPTTPYATRALYHYVSPALRHSAAGTIAWDPAAGKGHMGMVMEEYHGGGVLLSDAYNHGGNRARAFIHTPFDFTKREKPTKQNIGAIISNPPYKYLNAFIDNGLALTDRFLCLLVRIQALTGQTRYKKFYSIVPPSTIGIFSDRIPMKQNYTVRKTSKMFDHMWMVWDKESMPGKTETVWIPPNVQSQLEKMGDYDIES